MSWRRNVSTLGFFHELRCHERPVMGSENAFFWMSLFVNVFHFLSPVFLRCVRCWAQPSELFFLFNLDYGVKESGLLRLLLPKNDLSRKVIIAWPVVEIGLGSLNVSKAALDVVLYGNLSNTFLSAHRHRVRIFKLTLTLVEPFTVVLIKVAKIASAPIKKILFGSQILVPFILKWSLRLASIF